MNMKGPIEHGPLLHPTLFTGLQLGPKELIRVAWEVTVTMKVRKQDQKKKNKVLTTVKKSKSLRGSEVANLRRQTDRSKKKNTVTNFTPVTKRIKEQINAQNDLQKDLVFTRNFLAAIRVGVALVLNRIIIKTNNFFCKMTGYTEEELIGKPTRMLYPDDKDYLTKDKILFDDVQQEKYGIEGAIRRKDGSTLEVYVYASSFNIKNPSGGEVVTVVDISKRKMAERALEASTEQLHVLTGRLEGIREEERRSLSQELHDQLGQILTAISLDLEEAKKLDLAEHGLITIKLDSALKLTDDAIGIVKDVSAKLRPSLLDHLGLLAAIEWLTKEFERITGVRCERSLPAEELDIDEPRATTLFRILQEALTNVARHARAKRVKVNLTESANEIFLSVADNGVGISDRDLQNPKSIGLLGIQERLRPFKGISTFRRGPHGGTEVLIQIPKSIKE